MRKSRIHENSLTTCKRCLHGKKAISSMGVRSYCISPGQPFQHDCIFLHNLVPPVSINPSFFESEKLSIVPEDTKG